MKTVYGRNMMLIKIKGFFVQIHLLSIRIMYILKIKVTVKILYCIVTNICVCVCVCVCKMIDINITGW
jgi:hypothetical protein